MNVRSLPPHLAHLPVVSGLPVPWVVSWSKEQQPGLIHVEWTEQGIRGVRGTVSMYGMTWIDLGMMLKDSGVPDFGATSSHRQRRCMRGRCQVCGEKIVGTPYWIIPSGKGWVGASGRPFETKQPPVCRLCAATAPQWCPHLRHHPWQLFRAHMTPLAVAGDGWVNPTEELVPGVVANLDDPSRRWVLGRELIVRLDDPEEIDPEYGGLGGTTSSGLAGTGR